MSRAGATSPGSYARRLERALSEAHGRAVVLSPRDWSLLSRWYEKGVPLTLVLETFEEISRSRCKRRAGPPRDLAGIARAVEEAWNVVRDGRLGGRGPDRERAAELPPLSQALARIRQVAAGAEFEGLRSLLHEALARIEGGAEPSAVDAEIDRRLADAVEPARAADARRRIDERFARHRGRMEESVLATTRTRALADALREELGLPRLGWRDPTR